MRVVPRRTVGGDIDRFDNLNGSHQQSQVKEEGFHSNVTTNSSSRDYSHPDDQTIQTTETPGFKTCTVLKEQTMQLFGACKA